MSGSERSYSIISICIDRYLYITLSIRVQARPKRGEVIDPREECLRPAYI